MPKPLRSSEPGQAKDVQFAHFGVLDSGHQSKGSLLTAIITNVLLALIAIILGAAVHTVVKPKENVSLVVPLAEKPPEPIKPKVIPPKLIPPKPVPKPPEPKIKLPDVKVIEPPKPVAVTMPKPLPVVTPAPPKAVVAAAAPKPVAVNLAQSASIVNHDAHPSAVALGHPDNPIAVSNRPATSAVNLGNKGLAGMPASNTGGGPPSTRVNLGSGQPGGSLGGTGTRAVTGVKLGVTGGTPNGTGNGVGTRPAQVSLAVAPPPPPTPTATVARAAVRQGPQVTYKPRPVYTAEATAKHIEGNVSVKIHVAATGAVSVIGVTNGLGYGLDEAAVRAVQGTRFKPAVDASGTPIDWDGTVLITFQLAG